MLKHMAIPAAIVAATFVSAARADDEPKAADTDPAAMFAKLDTNKDGQLSGDEVSDEHKRLFERLLRTADKNNDKKLDGEEFAAGLASKPDKAAGPDEPDRPREGKPEGRPDGRFFARLDANGDGKIVLDEVPEERRERFAKLIERLDKDGDKGLTKEEFAAGRPDGDPKPETPEQPKKPEKAKKPEKPKKAKRPEGRPDAAQFFERFDANSDGKVTLDEVPEPLRPRIEKLMDRADKDGDKALSAEEFAVVQPPKRPERPGDDRGGPPAGFFRALDTDRDGKLSGDEISAAADTLRKLDADGDGSLSIEEFLPAGRKPEKND